MGRGSDHATKKLREAALHFRRNGTVTLQIGDHTFIAKNAPTSRKQIRKMQTQLDAYLAIPVRTTIAPNWLETSSARNSGCLCETPGTSTELGPSHKENSDA